MDIAENLGTRSWEEHEQFIVNQIVYVYATYFDNPSVKTGKYSDGLQHKQKSLLQGKVVNIYCNSLDIKFDFDNAVSSVHKQSVIITLKDNEKQFIIVKKGSTEEEDNNKDQKNRKDEERVSEYESEDEEEDTLELDDSVNDPDYSQSESDYGDD